ncbi:atos homolog protein B [Spea bombifrons]|uniref:atos homolog protein B n=1 Tax=Spea bombifrons TaxID=233779 RepID=UPI00234B36DB|nr:atos homolog protein B [Spea bombifrons]
MRHIQMETASTEEAGADGCLPADIASAAPGQPGLVGGGPDRKVHYPENELKLHKVYHVSITSPPSSPSQAGLKTCHRQALKRSPPHQLPPEPARSPKRALWGQSRNDGPYGQCHLDGDRPSCSSFGEEEEDQDTFEDGLLSDEMPLCGSAQHFSHSGLHVIEHRVEGFPPRDPLRKRLLVHAHPNLGCRRTDALSPPPYTSLHNSPPRDKLLVSPKGLSAPCEDNGANHQAEGATASRRHIIDNVLHKIAHSEAFLEKGVHDLQDGGYSNGGGMEAGTAVDEIVKEPVTPRVSAQKLPDGEDLGCSDKTPPGLGRLCPPGCSNTGVKRKLLPSGEAADSCSEEEGQSKRWRPGQSCQALHGACRSTDSKAAPFWNHLLPAARNPQKSPSDCAPRRLKRGLRLKTRSLRSPRKGPSGRSCAGNWTSSCISRSLLGNFEESVLRGRFPPSGQIEGFTAEIGASGSYCPQHVTLPVEVTYFHISEHSMPSPFLGVVDLEAVGKKGYSVPSTGTIQVTLFNPNKTVVKMFLVTYDFKDMPPNHVTFLRHRIFLVPVHECGEGAAQESPESGAAKDRAKKILCYLMHLRFHRSKSGKIYLHDDIRLLFSRKSIEVDTGIPYELKSFTESPKNPKYSPRL